MLYFSLWEGLIVFLHSITIILYLFWSAWIVLEINLKHKITVYYQENLKKIYTVDKFNEGWFRRLSWFWGSGGKHGVRLDRL